MRIINTVILFILCTLCTAVHRSVLCVSSCLFSVVRHGGYVLIMTCRETSDVNELKANSGTIDLTECFLEVHKSTPLSV